MMKKRLAVGIVMVAGLMTAVPSAVATHSWGGYHWGRTQNPFPLQLGDNVTQAWDGYLATTSTDWSTSTVLDTVIVTGRTDGRKCRATTGRVEVCNASYGPNGWLGVASISISGSHITAGTVKVNDTYFSTTAYNTPAWKNLVMCQEVGHALGLDHQDVIFNNPNLNTCMDYTNSPDTNQHPNAHDYDQLVSIYGHPDSTTTLGSVSATASASDASTPWGRLVSGSHRSGHSVYVLDRGKGDIVVTHVTWAV